MLSEPPASPPARASSFSGPDRVAKAGQVLCKFVKFKVTGFFRTGNMEHLVASIFLINGIICYLYNFSGSYNDPYFDNSTLSTVTLEVYSN